MAGRDHKLTRRAVLGVAFVVPAAAAGPEAREAAAGWGRAVAAFRRAEAELAAVQHWAAGRDAGAAASELDELFGDRLDALYDALRRLLRAPAPDWRALAIKVQLVVDHEVFTLTGGERCLASLKADARRLALKSG
jgi:hypothetical protein